MFEDFMKIFMQKYFPNIHTQGNPKIRNSSPGVSTNSQVSALP